MEGSLCSRLCLYDALPQLLKNGAWVNDFANQLKNGEMTALDFAVMSQEEESTIRCLYESDPTQLKQITLEMACKHGAPGVIPFFAKAKPELVSCASNKVRFPITLAMSEGPGELRPSEDDIKSLVVAWPGSLIKSEHNPLRQCVTKGYSSSLFEFMLSQLPERIENFAIFGGLHVCDIEWISRVLANIHGSFKLGYFPADSQAFHHVLKLIFQNNNLKKLGLTFPSAFLNASGSEDGAMDGQTIALLKSLECDPSLCSDLKVENLKLVFRYLPDSYSACLSLMDSLPHWSCLRTLDVDFGNHLMPSKSGHVLVQLLEQGTLQDLSLKVQQTTQKRKNSKEKEPLLLRSILDALTLNASLKTLSIFGTSEKESQAYRRLLISTLKENTTLRKSFGKHTNNNNGRRCEEVTYYLDLNSCGRAVARDTTTSLVEFVELLSSAGQNINLQHKNLRRLLRAQHGLLHEAVGAWAASQSSCGLS